MECVYCSSHNGDKHERMCLDCWYFMFWPMTTNALCECGSNHTVYEIEQNKYSDCHYGVTCCVDCGHEWDIQELPLTPFVMLRPAD